MYIINPEKINIANLYMCSGVIAEWLVYTKKIPLLGKGKEGEWYFSKTKELEEALEQMPFYLRITKYFW